jgi:hypothetical protein
MKKPYVGQTVWVYRLDDFPGRKPVFTYSAGIITSVCPAGAIDHHGHLRDGRVEVCLLGRYTGDAGEICYFDGEPDLAVLKKAGGYLCWCREPFDREGPEPDYVKLLGVKP